MSSEEKIITRDTAVRIRGELKAAGKVVGYTSGVFDLLHPGHVEYLEAARNLCDFLFVGLNSDQSVRALKGPSRPINAEAGRARVLAGLSSVDAVFIFDEKNNNENTTLLKPDRYIKAGDYDKATLSSAAIVESYGGRVEVVPFKEGFSTTQIIEKLRGEEDRIAEPSAVPALPAPAVFLDRDGTLIEHIDYLHEASRVQLFPGVSEGLRRLKEAGYRLVMVTNQPGIGLGYFTKEDFFAVTKALFRQLGPPGGLIDKVYFCPHSMSEKCGCRKPNTELLERAVTELGIVKEKSYFIGDMTSDIECGKRFGCKTILVASGAAGKDELFPSKADIVAQNFTEAVEAILSGK